VHARRLHDGPLPDGPTGLQLHRPGRRYSVRLIRGRWGSGPFVLQHLDKVTFIDQSAARLTSVRIVRLPSLAAPAVGRCTSRAECRSSSGLRPLRWQLVHQFWPQVLD
jgi:hypothetical protein